MQELGEIEYPNVESCAKAISLGFLA